MCLFLTVIIVDVKLIFKDVYDRLNPTDSFVILGRKSGGAKTSLPFISQFPCQVRDYSFLHIFSWNSSVSTIQIAG